MSEKLFGRVFEPIGSLSLDLLLKTKGQVKIKWGNKYIDLIKDGNINYPKEEVKKLIEEIVNLKLLELQKETTQQTEQVAEIDSSENSFYLSDKLQEQLESSQKTLDTLSDLTATNSNLSTTVSDNTDNISTLQMDVEDLKTTILNLNNLKFVPNMIILWKGDSIPEGWLKSADLKSAVEGYHYIIKL